MLRPGDERERGWLGRVWGYFAGGALTSIVAGAATLLFSIYHFQQTAPLSVLGNLMSVVLIGFVMMPAALIATLLMPFGLEAPFLLLMGWSIDCMLWVASMVAVERGDKCQSVAAADRAGAGAHGARLVHFSLRRGTASSRRCCWLRP